MKTINQIHNHLRDALKHSAVAVAVAVAVGLATGSVQALTTTQTINLGTSPASTNFPTTGEGSLIVWIPLGSLPPGSILRSVTATNLKLETQLGNSWASDLGVFIDPTPGTPGGDGLLRIGDDSNYGGSANEMGWGGGQNDGPFTGSRTELDWTGDIDLNTAAVMLGNGWAGNTAYSGTITVEYDAAEPAVILAFGPGAVVGNLVANAADITWTVPYGTDVTILAPTFVLSSGSCDKDNGGPTTYDFTSPVVYTVTDGLDINTYTVSVTVTPASSENNILTFGPGAIITGTNISWTVPFGSDVTTLAPAYTVSTFASPDGTFPTLTPRDFTSAQTYTITAQDLTTQIYTVTVTVAPDESTVIWDLTINGVWDTVTPNWRGQVSNALTPFFNGKNVIFNKPQGGTITIDPNMAPLSTTVSAPSGTYFFSGGPLTTGSLTKTGNGNLTISSVNNTFSGGTVIEAGQLTMDVLANSALGTGPVTLNGGRLFLERVTVANNLIVNGGTLVPSNGFGDTWNGTVTLNTTLIVAGDGNSGHMFFNGIISGVGGLTFTGPGALRPVLVVANSYMGPTSVTDCTLRCDHVDALGSGDLSISSGAKVNLNYVGEQNVASLTLGGVPQTLPGTYGSSASGADHQDDTYFTSTSTGKVKLGNDYDDWLGEFTFEGGADTTPTGDPDGDGMTNEDEYSFGLNPTLGSSVSPITQLLDKTTGIFKYTRRATPATTGITYAYEWSTSLVGTWNTFTPVIDPPATDSATPVEEITVQVPGAQLANPSLFVRVTATPAP